MINRSHERLQTRTRILMAVTAAALVVCAAAAVLKQDSSLVAQGTPEQSDLSYYIPNISASQESGTPAASPAEREPAPRTPAPSPSAPPEESYLVKVYEGKIGVFEKGKASPLLTADVNVYLLPQKDQELLKKGISAKSFGEVKGILEDYQ